MQHIPFVQIGVSEDGSPIMGPETPIPDNAILRSTEDGVIAYEEGDDIPPLPFNVAAYQAQAIAQVEAERDRRLYSTFTDSQGVTWIVDDRGRKQLSDRLLLTLGGMSPASWEWTIANGNGVTMTPESLRTLCAELAAWHDANFVACRVAVGAIGLEQTRATIDAIVAAVAWPA